QIDDDDGVVLVINNKSSAKNPAKRPTTLTSIPRRTSSIPNIDAKPRERSSVSIIPSSTFKSNLNNVNLVHRPLEKISDSDSSRRGSRITPKQSISNSSTNKSPVRNVKSHLYNNAQLSKNSPPVSLIVTPKRDSAKSLSSVSSSALILNRNSYLKKSPPISPIITPKRDSAGNLPSTPSSTLIQNR
ncbi:10523_t:CDS:2, partial [Dentiscutata heterogama]